MMSYKISVALAAKQQKAPKFYKFCNRFDQLSLTSSHIIMSYHSRVKRTADSAATAESRAKFYNRRFDGSIDQNGVEVH